MLMYTTNKVRVEREEMESRLGAREVDGWGRGGGSGMLHVLTH